MMLPHVALGVVLVLTSIAAAIVALMIVSRFVKRDSPLLLAPEPGLERAIFLFEGPDLLDATDAGRRLLKPASQGATDRDRFLIAFSAQFDDLAGNLDRQRDAGEFVISGHGEQPLRLVVHDLGASTRIELVDPWSTSQGVVIDAMSHRAQALETDLLRDMASASPVMAWRYDARGRIDWANRAYLARVAEHQGVSSQSLAWPLPDLLPQADRAAGALPKRQRLLSPDPTRTQWYDCQSASTSSGILHFASPADTVVKAETALREFVQTLTKTFAHLPIGLAIFDRHRQLALFNPALIDLTSLAPDFLSSRPTLFAFLDMLREVRMIPEPKDYHTWRQTMTELEKAAASGLYEETWSLPTGQTYRVTGRPHPDGAVAFLLEDITAEISLSRRFRSEIELGNEVLDLMPEAVAVFSPAGVIEMSNAAYVELWGTDPGVALATVSISDAARHWQTLTVATPFWNEARDFVLDDGRGRMVSTTVRLKDGRALACRLVALSRGATLATFRLIDGEAPAPRQVRSAAQAAAQDTGQTATA